MVMVGLLHMGGKGFPEDVPEGFAWIERAAQAGHASAQEFLGRHYVTGKILKKNAREGGAVASQIC